MSQNNVEVFEFLITLYWDSWQNKAGKGREKTSGVESMEAAFSCSLKMEGGR